MITNTVISGEVFVSPLKFLILFSFKPTVKECPERKLLCCLCHYLGHLYIKGWEKWAFCVLIIDVLHIYVVLHSSRVFFKEDLLFLWPSLCSKSTQVTFSNKMYTLYALECCSMWKRTQQLLGVDSIILMHNWKQFGWVLWCNSISLLRLRKFRKKAFTANRHILVLRTCQKHFEFRSIYNSSKFAVNFLIWKEARYPNQSSPIKVTHSATLVYIK